MHSISKNFLKSTLIALFILPLSFFAFAQNEPMEASLDLVPVLLEEESILIPSEVEKNIFYVDLELLGGNLSDLQLMNKNGEVVLNSSLKDIPEDALYELDLSHIESGWYQFQIRTYKKEIKKDIIVE